MRAWPKSAGIKSDVKLADQCFYCGRGTVTRTMSESRAAATQNKKHNVSPPFAQSKIGQFKGLRIDSVSLYEPQ